MLDHISVLVDDCNCNEVVILVDLVHYGSHDVKTVSVLNDVTIVLTRAFACSWLLISVLIAHVRVCRSKGSSIAKLSVGFFTTCDNEVLGIFPNLIADFFDYLFT
jgi:hypothetical protein